MRRALLRRWAWHPVGFIVLFATVFSGCAGNGCSCMTPIPGGFPAAQRTKNAAQVRVSQTGMEAAHDAAHHTANATKTAVEKAAKK